MKLLRKTPYNDSKLTLMRVNDFEIKGDSSRRQTEKTGWIIEMGHLGKEFHSKGGYVGPS